MIHLTNLKIQHFSTELRMTKTSEVLRCKWSGRSVTRERGQRAISYQRIEYDSINIASYQISSFYLCFDSHMFTSYNFTTCISNQIHTKHATHSHIHVY